MTPGEIKSIVHGVLAEQRDGQTASFDEAIVKTVLTILTSLGIDHEDRREMRADFHRLRCWRKRAEQMQSDAFKAGIAVIITGFTGLVWFGIKVMLGK